MIDGQIDRNEFLKQAVIEGLGELDDFTVKLTPTTFSVFGGDELAELANNAESGFELAICSALKLKLGKI